MPSRRARRVARGETRERIPIRGPDRTAVAGQSVDAFNRRGTILVNLLGLPGSHALAPLANLLNPALIVLGGSVAQSGEILLAAVREAIYRRAHPLITRNLRVVRSQLGATAGLVGSAHAVLDEIFLPSMAQSWVVHGSPRKEHSFLARLDDRDQ